MMGSSGSSGWSPSASHQHQSQFASASNPRGSLHAYGGSLHHGSSGPTSKIQAFTELTVERRAQLAAKFRFDEALLAPILAHFLKAARAFSPHARQYVISEAALAVMLRSQLANERMINRFFHIFARDDGHGMLYEEFLMLLYSISRDARTFSHMTMLPYSAGCWIQ